MATSVKQWMDKETGLIDSSIFADEQIYQQELERIFGRAWLFISHVSLLPNSNDFFLTYMGEDPVILTRDSKGELHAFLNMCRHRGNRIVRADDGNAKNFMCAYHGWTYSNEGKLVSVPGLQEAYYGELDVDNLGLVPVAHLETYAGFVFATWAEDAPSLKAYLGDVRWYLDIRYNSTDNGNELQGPVKWMAPFNWKTPVENASHDMYHVGVTHLSASVVQARFRKSPLRNRGEERFSTPGQRQVHAGNGHSLTATVREEGTFRRVNQGGGDDGGRAEAYEKSMLDEAIRRLGQYRATRISNNGSLFPNMWLGPNLAFPRGPLKTEMWVFNQVDVDMPQDLKDDIRRRQPQNSASHPAGLFLQDDMDNWRSVTDSGRTLMTRRWGQRLSMGIGHEEESVPGYPGLEVARACAETGQRGYIARWEEFMNAESWADIHIDPITAAFEGTATI
jgi:3-phenylpropionate/trans-cinnamate dioxygenase alpha subunit